MDYKVVFIISSGDKNTRYLIQDDCESFFSIKVPTGSYRIGDVFSYDENLIPAKQEWIEKFKNQKDSYPRSQLMKHLRWYKQTYLKDNSNGKYRGSVKSHIFDAPEKNLLCSFGYQDVLIDKMNSLGDELRTDFTHLTSSQAFAVNFFSPLMKENKLSIINQCFVNSISENCSFEEILDTNEETQFDFLTRDFNNKPLCSVEVKYSESGFGSTIGDTKHLDKLTKEYRDNMRELTIVDEQEWSFFEFYQVWRNLLYTIRHRGQHICFLFPRFREDLKKTLEEIFAKCKEEYRQFFHIIVADDIVEDIIHNYSSMKPYYEEFKLKYLDINRV